MIFSWQNKAWGELGRYRAQLPHAILLREREGLGGEALARTFAQSLLCETPQEGGLPCGRCPECNWFVRGNHPDFRLLHPDSLAPDTAAESDEPAPAKKEKKSEQIRIDQVRALQ